MRLFPVILLALCCCACGPEIAPESTATKETTATETDELKPGILDGFPTEVIESGCDCSLRLENNQDKDLFFVFDWQGDGGGKLNTTATCTKMPTGRSKPPLPKKARRATKAPPTPVKSGLVTGEREISWRCGLRGLALVSNVAL